MVAIDADAAATLADGTIVRPRWIVAADGHYSPVRRMLTGSGATRASEPWQAFRQYFSGVDDRRLWVLFEEDLLPGYAWVFPVGDGRANLGFGVLRDANGGAPSGKALAAQWRSLADRPSVRRALGPNARPEGTVRAWPIPADYDRARLTHGRALFVGDAANVVDPMTGEGIAQAIETGMLAARAIAASPDQTERRRRPLPRRRSTARSAPTCASRRCCNTSCGTRSAHAPPSPPPALTPWTRRNFARWMFEDYPPRPRVHARPLAPGPADPPRRLPRRLVVDVLAEALQTGLRGVAEVLRARTGPRGCTASRSGCTGVSLVVPGLMNGERRTAPIRPPPGPGSMELALATLG